MGSFKYFLSALLIFSSNIFSQYFWTEQVTGVTANLTSVSNIDGNVAWVCGYNGTVIKTSNAGYNWANHSGDYKDEDEELKESYEMDNRKAVDGTADDINNVGGELNKRTTF